jgi:hypothetical protein
MENVETIPIGGFSIRLSSRRRKYKNHSLNTSYIGGQAPRTVINECPICMTNYVTKMLDNAVTSSNTSVGLSAFCTS